MDEPTYVRRYIDLPPHLAEFLDRWAESEKRSSKAQLELVIEPVLEQQEQAQRVQPQPEPVAAPERKKGK